MFLALGIAHPSWAGFGVETKITATDAAAGDIFGTAVAISGSTVVVGAPQDNSLTGSVYFFNAFNGGQLHKVTASDPATSDGFGTAVAISDSTAIVGAGRDDDACSGFDTCDSGSAYLFDADPTSPNFGDQLFKLTASDAALGDFFGTSVAISGNTAIIGAYRDDDGGSNSGSAYLFDVTTGTQLIKLTADDAGQADIFGISVAISGGTAIVGAGGDDDGGGSSGAAYVFDADPDSPNFGDQLFKLTAEDAAAGDMFGWTVAISGATAIVSASLNDDACPSNVQCDSGSAYLFDVTTGNQLVKLIADDAAEGDEFGRSVAISGSRAVVGAYFDDHAGFHSGSAYVFDADPSSANLGNELVKLTASDAAASDVFGISVGVSGGTAIVGAWTDDAGNGSGSAYIFTPEPSTLTLAALALLGLLAHGRRRRG